MSNQEKDEERPKQHPAEKDEAWIDHVLVFAFFIFIVLLGYFVRS